MTGEEAEGNGANPCPRCFPDSEYGQGFGVIDRGGGMSRYVPKSPDETTNEK